MAAAAAIIDALLAATQGMSTKLGPDSVRIRADLGPVIDPIVSLGGGTWQITKRNHWDLYEGDTFNIKITGSE